MDELRKTFFDQDEYQPKNCCNSWVATAIVGGAVVGGVAKAYSASLASDAQASAADKAAAASMDMYYRTRQDLAPYRDEGQYAMTELNKRLEHLVSPIEMDQAALEKTPGYQFTKAQGLKAVQNSAAARGLGVSGAALKGGATFATELANKTYQDQFNLENVNRTNTFNRLKSLVDTGLQAGIYGGSIGQKSADTSAQAAMAKGNAEAAGYNAIGGAVSGMASDIGGYMAYRGLYGNRAGTSPAGSGRVGEFGPLP